MQNISPSTRAALPLAGLSLVRVATGEGQDFIGWHDAALYEEGRWHLVYLAKCEMQRLVESHREAATDAHAWYDPGLDAFVFVPAEIPVPAGGFARFSPDDLPVERQEMIGVPCDDGMVRYGAGSSEWVLL